MKFVLGRIVEMTSFDPGFEQFFQFSTAFI